MAHSTTSPSAASRARMHPLVVAAVVSFIALCTVAIAVLTGLLPSPLARTADRPDAIALQQEADEAAEKARTAIDDANVKAAAAEAARAGSAPVRRASVAADTPAPAPAPRRVVQACTNCGVVSSVTSYKVKGEGSGLGAVAGGVLGGVVGNQFGGGNGKTALTILGAGGGAYAGHEVEKNMRSQVRYQMKVRMEDGSTRTFTSASPFGWRNGDPVRVVNGKVVARNNGNGGGADYVDYRG